MSAVMIITVAIGVVFLYYAREAYAFPGGAPSQACSTLTPSHSSFQPQISNNPYKIDLSVFDDGNGTYQPGNSYQLLLQHQDGSTPFRGFFIQARLMAADNTQVGAFSNPPANSRLSSCSPTNIGITHDLTGLSGTNRDRTSVTVTWTAPPEGTGPIRFGYAVVQVFSTFWANARTDVIQEAIQPQVTTVPLQPSLTVSDTGATTPAIPTAGGTMDGVQQTSMTLPEPTSTAALSPTGTPIMTGRATSTVAPSPTGTPIMTGRAKSTSALPLGCFLLLLVAVTTLLF